MGKFLFLHLRVSVIVSKANKDREELIAEIWISLGEHASNSAYYPG